MKKPLVSVIIPTYNRAGFLKFTLESVLNQTYQNIEVFVIDDGSSNNEAEEVCAAFEKVTYIKIENSGGPAKPRNIGIQKAKGKYLAFVDDDDIWLPTKLELQVEILEQNSDFGLVHGCCEIINEEGVLQAKIVGRPGSPDVKHGDVSLKMMGNWTVMMPTSFVRKEVMYKVGYFNEKIPAALEDVEFWTRCSFETKFYYLEEPLVHYRVHNKNISTKNINYIKLPLYLKNVLKNQIKSNQINQNEFLELFDNLVKSQIKMFDLSFFMNIYYLFKLNKLWFLNFSNLKLMTFILFFKK